MSKCSGCKLDKPIQNKRHNLCGDCIFEKTHGGKSRQEIYSERAAQRPKKNYVFKKSAVKQQTQKEKGIKEKLREVRGYLELLALLSDGIFCKSCGTTDGRLDHSHIIAVGDRKDLETDPDNIRFQCRKCHQEWESKNVELQAKSACFLQDLEYICVNDADIFQRILTRINAFLSDFKGAENQVVITLKKAQKIYENCR